MPTRTTAIVSRGRSNNPAKRALEQAIVAGLEAEPDIDTIVLPHLNDLPPDDVAVQSLRSAAGDLIVLSWLYPRAAFWILDRHGVRGQKGQVLLMSPDERRDGGHGRKASRSGAGVATDAKARVADDRPAPARRIYCVDLRIRDAAQPFLAEIQRIIAKDNPRPPGLSARDGVHPATRMERQPSKRWYPVIDFSRCTNCMECNDFCLFGVYGIDEAETILVEQPDNCRNGCPACSRVCPENAIIFPEHKTPAIAGSSAPAETKKLNLSQLFAAPSAWETAARERAKELAENNAQAASPTEPDVEQRRDGERQVKDEKDELDKLIDSLDEFDP